MDQTGYDRVLLRVRATLLDQTNYNRVLVHLKGTLVCLRVILLDQIGW